MNLNSTQQPGLIYLLCFASCSQSCATRYKINLYRMLSDGFVTRAVACAMVGLFFCFIYSIVMLYRENLKSLRIRHIFGLSMKQITLGSLGIATLIAAVAVGVFSVILFSGLSYMSKHDLNRLFCYITVGIAALSAGTSLVCAISTNRAVSRRERP